MNRSDFKFSTKFKSVAKIIEAKADKITASIESLKNLLNIPQEQIDENPDLLYVSGDLWVGGMANKNDDAITAEDTVELAKQIPHKYLNLEHDDKVIVGTLLNYGFREYNESREFVEIEDVDNYEGEIVAAGGGFIWRSAYPELGDLLIEASDEKSEEYGSASFSWEVLFNDYYIMEGSKFVKDAEIIKDPKEIEKRKSSLRGNGGSGLYNGKEVYRLVVGPKLFLGAGVVGNPAADVEGILTTDTAEHHEEEKVEASVDESLAKINEILGDSNIKEFGEKLSEIAKDIGPSFEAAAKAAEEFARQGLSSEDVLKRTKDALILSRMSEDENEKISIEESIKGLTEVLNGFEKSAAKKGIYKIAANKKPLSNKKIKISNPHTKII